MAAFFSSALGIGREDGKGEAAYNLWDNSSTLYKQTPQSPQDTPTPISWKLYGVFMCELALNLLCVIAVYTSEKSMYGYEIRVQYS